MKLTIDNLQGLGPVDYTLALDATVAPKIERRINQPSTFTCTLLANTPEFVAPEAGGRLTATRSDGSFLFTGYLTHSPIHEYLGWGQGSAAYRYALVAESDEVLLDQKALPNRAPFVSRTAGSALRQLAADVMPGGFDTTGVQDVDTLATYTVNPQKSFSYHAGEIALGARACYRALNSALTLTPVGTEMYAIDETDPDFSPEGLKVDSANLLINDVIVSGLDEPQCYVRDYFVGDGLSRSFYLSQTPLPQSRPALIDEEYVGPGLDPTVWSVNDPDGAVSVTAQTLQVKGGTGKDGGTTVCFAEQVELGGALELQHGDVCFTGNSQGIVGGLYSGAVSQAACLAGFQVTPAAGGTNIQALVNGSPTGPVVATKSAHRYVFTTYIYSMEVYRAQEIYHSGQHAGGNGRGGATIPADVRFVLEVQDIDPANPASLVAPATVLYDGVITNAPAFCAYALVNAANMVCSIAYTYATHISLAEVRMALPNDDYVTQLVGSLSSGGECSIASSTSLDYYPQYVPPLNALIVASYRGYGRAVAEIADSASIAALQAGSDNGVRSKAKVVKSPSARTQTDCENAALAILDDAVGQAWSGTYETWSDCLPGEADDIFPGDGVAVNVPSRNADFRAIVRAVAIDLADPANDRGIYSIEFANDLAQPLALEEGASSTVIPLQDLPVRLSTAQVGSYYLANLTDAQVTQVTSTSIAVDAGCAPGVGYGIEVRAHDYGWGVSNDRNLLGRFNSQTFSLPRLARTQNYFLRLYDNSSPPRYSRYAAALHVDYPL